MQYSAKAGDLGLPHHRDRFMQVKVNFVFFNSYEEVQGLKTGIPVSGIPGIYWLFLTSRFPVLWTKFPDGNLMSPSRKYVVRYFIKIFHSFIFILAFTLERVAGSSPRARNTSRFLAIPDNLAGSTPKRDQARWEIESYHLILVRSLGRFPVGATSQTCLAKLYWGTLVSCSNHRSWDLFIRNSRFSTGSC